MRFSKHGNQATMRCSFVLARPIGRMKPGHQEEGGVVTRIRGSHHMVDYKPDPGVCDQKCWDDKTIYNHYGGGEK